MMRALIPSLFSLVLTVPLAAQDQSRVLIVTGQNNHDWEFTSKVHRQTLEKAGLFSVEITTDPAKTLADEDAIAGIQAFVLDYNGKRWGEAAERNFVQAVEGGAGVVVIHAANNAFPGWKEYETMVGLLWRKGTGHGRFHPFDVEVFDRKHPITLDLPDMIAQPDELYHRLVHLHNAQFRVLMNAFSTKASRGTGRYEPMLLVARYGRGRIAHTPLGHVWRKQPQTHRSVESPQFRNLLARCTEWAATGRVTLPLSTFGLAPREPNTLSAGEVKRGWRLLFDGKTSDGWVAHGGDAFPPAWKVDAGCLRCAKGGGGDIVTTESFGDFELRFDWRITPGGNSGLMYRVSDAKEAAWHSGPEFQVLNTAKNPKTRTGALYALYANDRPELATDDWNHGVVRVAKNHVEHWVNGVKVVDCDLASDDFAKRVAGSKFNRYPGFAKSKRGRIALQAHGADVRWRNLAIRELDAK